jgi:hypothetical protein
VTRAGGRTGGALAGISAKVVIPVVIEGDPATSTATPEMKKTQGYLGFHRCSLEREKGLEPSTSTLASEDSGGLKVEKTRA